MMVLKPSYPDAQDSNSYPDSNETHTNNAPASLNDPSLPYIESRNQLQLEDPESLENLDHLYHYPPEGISTNPSISLAGISDKSQPPVNEPAASNKTAKTAADPVDPADPADHSQAIHPGYNANAPTNTVNAGIDTTNPQYQNDSMFQGDNMGPANPVDHVDNHVDTGKLSGPVDPIHLVDPSDRVEPTANSTAHFDISTENHPESNSNKDATSRAPTGASAKPLSPSLGDQQIRSKTRTGADDSNTLDPQNSGRNQDKNPQTAHRAQQSNHGQPSHSLQQTPPRVSSAEHPKDAKHQRTTSDLSSRSPDALRKQQALTKQQDRRNFEIAHQHTHALCDSIRRVIYSGQVSLIVNVPHSIIWLTQGEQRNIGSNIRSAESIARSLRGEMSTEAAAKFSKYIWQSLEAALAGASVGYYDDIEILLGSTRFKVQVDCYVEESPKLSTVIVLLTPVSMQNDGVYEPAQLSAIRYQTGTLLGDNTEHRHTMQPDAMTDQWYRRPNQPSIPFKPPPSAVLSSMRPMPGNPRGSIPTLSSSITPQAVFNRGLQDRDSQAGGGLGGFSNPNSFTGGAYTGYSSTSGSTSSRFMDPPSSGGSISTTHSGSISSSSGSTGSSIGRYDNSQPSETSKESSASAKNTFSTLQDRDTGDFLPIPSMRAAEVDYFYSLVSRSKNGRVEVGFDNLMVDRELSVLAHEAQVHDPDHLDPYRRLRGDSTALVQARRPRDPAEVAEEAKQQLMAQIAAQKAMRKCLECGTDHSPEWRKGPMGPKTLCNRCGLRYAKKLKIASQEK